jgi:uncharacterized protein YkwD
MRGAFGTFMAAACGALALAAPAGARAAAPRADALLAEINFARTQPQAYARRLLLQPVSDWEQGLDQPTEPGALAEAVAFLERQAPLPPLAPEDDLAAAAQEHVAQQGPAGAVGHEGPDGERFDARLARHGVAGRTEGEAIAYGPDRPADVVRELIIDSGVPGRGHRRNLFHPAFAAAGVTCGPHRDFGAMCVIDFASAGPVAPRLVPLPLQVADAETLAPLVLASLDEPAPRASPGGGWWWLRSLRTLLER